MKGFWKVLGLAALVGSIPFKAEKNDDGSVKTVSALLWQYRKVTDDEYADEVHHQLSIGLHLPDPQKVRQTVTGAFSRVKESAQHLVAVTEEDFADNDAE